MSVRKALLVLLCGLAIGSPLRFNAAFAAAPLITIAEAHAFEHVVEADDLLVLIRYNLPVADWQNTTYMDDFTCADNNNVQDPCFTTLRNGAAFLRLYNGVPVVSEGLMPRIGGGLNAVYLPAGHGVTFGDAGVSICVEGVIVPTPTQTCASSITWHSTASVTATKTLLTSLMPTIVVNLQQQMNKPKNNYVNLDKITQIGAVFATEAFSPMPLVAPDAFSAGVKNVGGRTVYTTAPALQSALDTAAQSSSWYQGAALFSEEFLGVGIKVAGGIGTIILGVLFGAGVAFLTRGNPEFTALATVPVLGSGVLMTFLPVGPALIGIAFLVILGGIWFFARVPG